ncbi:hypothetical protein M404DRAFT_995194 [Pisolithus tinctorius Marx 270]|uniref:Uncharacterized protein n=1 Tax=Pisolithus tinctorius Marx 270 TaxID=870435 RepID=A0A0C3PQC6_PISTI|nr:hypothetical protein M404DRAFT_995194 [Pisolithus tinctorius Marx 270]
MVTPDLTGHEGIPSKELCRGQHAKQREREFSQSPESWRAEEPRDGMQEQIACGSH